ncbi:MAG: hypothetical protein JW754_04970 [Candidatus Aenigmarchaeota archaeon]|nr:hypothetical protein [Candidatus Aenigmarchaeota archaeon]
MENESSSENSGLREKIRKLEEENKKLNQLVDTVEEKTKKLSDHFSDKRLYSFTDRGWVDTNMFGEKIKQKDDFKRKGDDFYNRPKSSNEAGKSSKEVFETRPKEDSGFDLKKVPAAERRKEERPTPAFMERSVKASGEPENLQAEKPLTVEGLNKQLMDIIQLIAKNKSKST